MWRSSPADDSADDSANASADDSGAPDVVFDLRGFYKSSASWLLLPRGLVDNSRELERAFAEAKQLLPAEQAAAFPASAPLPQQAALLTHTGRVWGALTLFDVDIAAAWQAAVVVATHEAFVTGQGGAFSTSVRAPQRRLLDFEPLLASQDGFALQHNLDQLSATFHAPAVTVVVGRQVVSWGTGRLWNPTDLFSPFAPTDVDREVRRGADAVRVSVPLSELSELELIWLPQLHLVDQGAVVRGRTNVFDNSDVSVTVAKYVADVVVGGDFVADVGLFGVYGEGAFTLPVDDALAGEGVGGAVDASFVRAVVGASCRPNDVWTLVGEYHFNGFGTDDDDEILQKMRDPRVVRGEVFGVGRHYAGIVSAFALDDPLTLATTTLVNLTDPGLDVIVALEWSIAQQVLLRAAVNAPFGSGADGGLFRGLHGSDVLSQSEGFERAITTFGARSEYGLAPLSVFVQLGAWFG